MMPGSRRRSREQENLLDDVPIPIRRRIHSDSAATESRAPVVLEGTPSQPTESRASPLVESVDRAGTTGARLDMMSDGWTDPTTQTPKTPGNFYQKSDCW